MWSWGLIRVITFGVVVFMLGGAPSASYAQANALVRSARNLTRNAKNGARLLESTRANPCALIQPWAPRHLVELDNTITEAGAISRGAKMALDGTKSGSGIRVAESVLQDLGINEAVERAVSQATGTELVVPENIAEWRFFEQLVNDIRQDAQIFAPIDVKTLPNAYNPLKAPVFDIGYLEIPLEDVRLWQSGILPRADKNFITFRRDGTDYVRFFVHPDSEEALAETISAYGGLQKGRYGAFPTSSPRSLVIWDKTDPTKIFGHKVSLTRTIGDVVRVNATDKLVRSAANNEAFAMIPRREMGRIGFDFFPESAQIQGPGLYFGTIHRQLPAQLTSGESLLLGGFSITGARPGTAPPLLIEMIERSGADPLMFVQEEIVRPLLRTHVNLSLKHGLVGELHQQNALHRISRTTMLPEGELWVRDLDSFKPDLALRAMNGESLEPYLNEVRPFKVLKANQAPTYHEIAYGDYLRNDWGYILNETLKSNRRRLGLTRSMFDDYTVRNMFDRVFLEEATRAVGSRAVFKDAKPFFEANRTRLEEMFPKVSWDDPVLSPEQVSELLDEFPTYRIFGGAKPRTPRKWSFNVNRIANAVKSEAGNSAAIDAPQDLLRREFDRLRENYRVSTRSALADDTVYELYHGAILAKSPQGTVRSIGLLEPRWAGAGYYAEVPYPRRNPGRGHGALWRRIDEATN